MENKESHNGRSIESLEQGGKQYNQAQCPASKADPLEIIDWDDRRPGYDPDKGEHVVIPLCRQASDLFLDCFCTGGPSSTKCIVSCISLSLFQIIPRGALKINTGRDWAGVFITSASITHEYAGLSDLCQNGSSMGIQLRKQGHAIFEDVCALALQTCSCRKKSRSLLMWRSLWLLQKHLKRTCFLDQMSSEMQPQMHVCTCAQP